MWKSNQFRMEIKGNFKVLLPEFEILDPYDQPLLVDYSGKIIFIALILNTYVPDKYLREISRSYKSAICQLRKRVEQYHLKIIRIRNVGYQILWEEVLS